MMMQKMTVLLLLGIAVSAAGQGQSRSNTPEVVGSQKNFVVLGMSADSVLSKRGKAFTITKIDSDQNGLIVELKCQDAIYLLARREKFGIEAYRVIKIT